MGINGKQTLDISKNIILTPFYAKTRPSFKDGIRNFVHNYLISKI